MANTTNFAIEKPTVGGYRNSWGGTLNVALDKISELLALALPIGTIQLHTAAAAPTATGNGGTWLICDGTAISRTTYSALYALVGTTYGVGDGTNTFNVPDLRSRSPIGVNTASLSGRSTRAIAANGGEETHALTEGELDQHAHSLPNTAHSHSITDQTHTHTGNASGNTGSASLTINDPGHYHTYKQGPEYQGGSVYSTAFDANPNDDGRADTMSNTTGITIDAHSHSLTTTAVATGITGTQTAVTGITTTNETGSNTAHNTMHPFLVVQYIILAKHPTF